jgi:hypothetical protein
MKTKIYAVIIGLISFIVFSCGGGVESLNIKIKDKDLSVKPKTVWFK